MSTSPAHPLTYSHFSKFLAKVITALGVDSRHYSLHSFRRDGATFTFASKVPAELIKFQGDWRSDTYLVYLEMSSNKKRQAVSSMATQFQQPSSTTL